MNNCRLKFFGCVININVPNIKHTLFSKYLIHVHYMKLSILVIYTNLNLVFQEAFFRILTAFAQLILIQFDFLFFKELFKFVISMVHH